MATLAREIPTDGLTTIVYFFNSAKNEYGDGIQLCGHDNLDFKDGKTDEIDTTDLCQAATGHKSSRAGAKENGTLSINMKRFDPRQPALAAYMNAPINSKLKIRVVYNDPEAEDADVCTYYCQKKVNPGWASKIGQILEGSLEVATVSDPVWSVEKLKPAAFTAGNDSKTK
ncbi:hypothetical protein [Snodgrassella alvi]|uniref:hypothetical protein n=1 Tax=Snodgrassella alvi TaxID=1196083 RepID=UPI000C1EC470|nr:hypothetical protein [Snodgrassella alvi]PIT48533.1 hypothetical protein BHC51_04625 [Snodgrassella alvi]